MSRVKVATVFTHRRPTETRHAFDVLRRVAADAGAELRFDREETEKHELVAAPGIVVDCDPDEHDDVDLAIVLGGDGTILTALRRYARTEIPVFAVNFGQVGFLATIESQDCDDGFARAFAGDYELLHLPAIAVRDGAPGYLAINDVSITRRAGDRVALLSYMISGEEVGAVRCDGLVVATPAGSTGYNLANGGPVLAWGVGGFAVSFIAPHSLTARALVVSPDDVVTVCNRSLEDPVEIMVDGRPTLQLEPGASIHIDFRADQAHLAQLPGSTFYRRLRDKFGHLV